MQKTGEQQGVSEQRTENSEQRTGRAVNKQMKKDIPKKSFPEGVPIVLGIFVAVFMLWSDIVPRLLLASGGNTVLGAFLGGVFFTSIITVVPATVALGQVAQFGGVFTTALFGAFGAVAGDLILFRFVRDRFAARMRHVMTAPTWASRLDRIICLHCFRWVTWFVGALFIISPLPDELGISLLGFSSISAGRFALLAFCLHFVGIFTVGLVATAL